MAGQTDVPVAVGTYFFKLSLGGAETAKYFKECTGLESSNTVVSSKGTDANGKPIVRKSPGQLEWANITLKRGVDDKLELWTWRQQVIDGQMSSARKDCSIQVIDWENKIMATYSFNQAWPCKYAAPGLVAEGDEVLVEEIEIAHEGFSRA
jgi:phage tail-like protein